MCSTLKFSNGKYDQRKKKKIQFQKPIFFILVKTVQFQKPVFFNPRHNIVSFDCCQFLSWMNAYRLSKRQGNDKKRVSKKQKRHKLRNVRYIMSEMNFLPQWHISSVNTTFQKTVDFRHLCHLFLFKGGGQNKN